MNTWYKKPATKGILLVIIHAMAVTMAVCLLMVIMIVGKQHGGSLDFSSKDYEDSANFTNLMHMASADVLSDIVSEEQFQTDGKYNPDKLVDILDYAENDKITGENKNGLVYKLGELRKWSQLVNAGNVNYEGSIVVCQKADGTYYYYYMDQFMQQLKAGTLVLEADHDMFLEELEQGYYTASYKGNMLIRNKDGETAYTDCWTIEHMVEEKYAPVGAANILEVVNKTPELNGKVSELYESLEGSLYRLDQEINGYEMHADTWKEGNTNFSYILLDHDKKKVYTNREAYADYKKAEAGVAELTKDTNKYIEVWDTLKDYKSNLDVSAEEWKSIVSGYLESGTRFTFVAAVDTKYPIQDAFYSDRQVYTKYAPYMQKMMGFCIMAAVIFIIAFIWLTITAGRSIRGDDIYLMAFDRIKTEIAAVLVVILAIAPLYVLFGTGLLGIMTRSYTYHMSDVYVYNQMYSAVNISAYRYEIAMVGVLVCVILALFLFGYLSLVRRIKAKTLWKNSLLCSIVQLAKIFWTHRTVTFRIAAAAVIFFLIHWFGIMISYGSAGIWSFVILIAEAVVFIYLIRGAIAKDKIKKGIKEIAGGNVHYEIPTDALRGEDLAMATAVNSIGGGLQKAVEESMRSERLKTDLITNVSHDIKTPLTSIINYVDILKRENFEDPKIQGYLDILEAKAQRLKHLTEDVVEASKVSSGNITLECMDINLVEMVNQTNGEFAEKFEKKQLEMVLNIPEEPAMVHADGRRMWRVLENIYGNAAKYAMPGTRVYGDLKAESGEVVFSLKNISEQPLNISEDELTERFIRGDISRSTEGSGLGLSIAKELTKLQGGTFELYLDGDLFKVTVKFPER